MTDQIAYLNGTLVARDQLHVSVVDTGFVMGVAVSERLRTFGGETFRMVDHLRRLRRSLEIVGLVDAVSLPDFAIIIEQLVAHNHRSLAAEDDLGICLFVTPGEGRTDENGQPIATTCIYTYPLPFANWVNDYEEGTRLVISDVQQIPLDCWPAELKCRSRMHYYLADQQARQISADARALLLDQDGNVSESSTANIVVYRHNEGLVSPPREKILPGISMSVLSETAERLRIPFVWRDLTPDEVLSADEVLLCSTSPCVWPVSRVDDQLIGGGRPGDVFERLMTAWNDYVGLDIRAQARQFANRSLA